MVNGDNTMTTMTRLECATLLMSAWAVSGQAEDLLRKDGVEGSLLGTKTGATAFLTCHKVSIDLNKIGKHTIVATDDKCPSPGVINRAPDRGRAAEESVYQRMIEKADSEAALVVQFIR